MSFPQEIVPELISYLKNLERRGIKSLYLDAATSELNVEPESSLVTPDHPAPEPKDTPVATPGATASVAGRLAELEAKVKVCTECGLHEGRTNSVFGTGDPATKVLFIGEGPGRDEDIQGLPFVGRSGQLLTRILAAIDLERKDVYITNMVKCRPPNNRDPQETEVRCCEQYLKVQIDLIKPRIICALGRIAAQWLLDKTAPLGEMRKTEHAYRGIPVLVTYHPAALLRNPGLKKAAWEDFKRLRDILID